MKESAVEIILPGALPRVYSYLSILLAVLGAWLMTAAFPPRQIGWLVIPGMALVCFSVLAPGIRQAVINALVAGCLYYALLYEWLRMFHAGGILFVSILYGILFFALPLVLGKLLSGHSAVRFVFLMPAVWVLFEYLKTLGPLAFGFGILGYSQYRYPLLIQISDLFGVWGVSCLLVLSAGFLAVFFLFLAQRLSGGSRSAVASGRFSPGPVSLRWVLTGAFVFILCWVGTLVYGRFQLRREVVSLPVRIQLAQFIHDAKVSWGENRDHYLDEYEQFFLLSAKYDPDLLILPENAVKRFVSVDPDAPVPGSAPILNRLSGLARDHETALLVGMLEQVNDGGEARRYNTAFLFDRHGDLAGRYRKHILAPFGETDPFQGLFPGLEEMLARDTDIIRLDRGRGKPILGFDSAAGRYSFLPLICFEGTSGRFVGSYIGDRAVDFLVVMTSDAWTESAGALLQHGAFAVFRAVETRKTVFRVGNGGLTCVINPRGVIVRQLPMFTRATLLSGLPVMETEGKTLYMRWGDWIPVVCGLGLAGYVLAQLAMRKRRQA